MTVYYEKLVDLSAAVKMSMIDIDEGFFKATSLSTAGAISVRDSKGRLVTQKVKVRRYAAGKLPDYAKNAPANDEYDDEEEEEEQQEREQIKAASVSHNEQEDRRIRRLQAQQSEGGDNERDRINRHRRIVEPEVLEASSEDEQEEIEEEEEEEKDEVENMDTEEKVPSGRVKMDIESSDDDEEHDEEEIERRRQRLRMKAREREEELLQVEDEKEPEEEAEPSEESESEEEEEEDDDDDGAPRLKPVFVRKDDRRTVAEREAEEKQQLQLEIEKKRVADQRRMQTQKMVAEAIRQEKLKEKETDDGIQCDFDTDDEDGETAYDAWRLRELTRLKRDREERDQREREAQELERWHNMTEEERQAELRKNPKIVDNQVDKKSKYKYLQKYYHRGAFFMDKDDELFKRDISAPTLEDHFDKSVLPKVMQVKNFGMAGRTKYTHLLDQDTTRKDSPWTLDKQTSKKFHNEHSGGMKQVFERPKLKNTSKKSH